MTKELNHAERAHSKFSASGSERWLNCAASVEMEESSPPSKDTEWSLEGTQAHEVLEDFLTSTRWSEVFTKYAKNKKVNSEMLGYAKKAAVYIKNLAKQYAAKFYVETRVYNTFIHEEMFGTIDSFIPVYKKILFVIDFKYGKGHIVSPEKNTQLIQYALGIAESYDWDFEQVTMIILQPRAGSTWVKEWTITMKELKEKWLPLWHKGVARVERGGNKPFAGSWCHWCRAKFKCELKNERRFEEITNLFGSNPLERTNENGKEKSSKKEKGFKKENRFEKEEIKKGKAKKEIKGKSRIPFGHDSADEESGTDGWGFY